MGGQFPNDLPTLRSALKLEGPRGMCFHRSVALCLDLPGSEVVIATFRAATPEEAARIPNASDVPFLHAWVEWEGKVFAPTLIESHGLIAQPPEGYHRVNGAKNIRRVSRRAIRKHVADKFVLNQLTGAPGPQPYHGYLVDRLLAAAGIKHIVERDGGVLPA
jgi:hypothetical protein